MKIRFPLQARVTQPITNLALSSSLSKTISTETLWVKWLSIWTKLPSNWYQTLKIHTMTSVAATDNNPLSMNRTYLKMINKLCNSNSSKIVTPIQVVTWSLKIWSLTMMSKMVIRIKSFQIWTKLLYFLILNLSEQSVFRQIRVNTSFLEQILDH